MSSPAPIQPAPARSACALWTGARGYARELAWVLAGKGALLGANMLLMVVLARHLPPETYGLFATVVGAQLLASRILLVGLDGGVIRLRNLGGMRPQELIRAGVDILIRTSAGLVVIALVAWPLLRDGAGRSWPGRALAAAVTGSIGVALIDFAYFCRLAELGYRSGTLVQGGPAVARFVATAIAVYALAGSAPLVFLTYGSASLVFGVWQVSALRGRELPAPRKPGLVRLILKYSVWQGTRSMLAAGGLAVRCVPVLTAIGSFLPRVTRPEIAAAVPVLYVLAGAMVLLNLHAPLEAASQYLLRPQFIVISWILRVVSMARFCVLFARGGGALEVAFAQLAAGALAFVVVAGMVGFEVTRAISKRRLPRSARRGTGFRIGFTCAA